MHDILIVIIGFICGFAAAEYNRYMKRNFTEIGEADDE